MTAVRSSPPLVSVVVPACNHNRYIELALDSVLAQGFADLEVIVVDDGSDTPIDALVRAKTPDATILRQENAGPSAARNAGIERSRGRFVTFLDADDVWLPTTLKRLLKGFRDAPGVDIVQGSVRQFITPGDVASLDAARNGPIYQGFNVGALLARRAILLGQGRFDESLRLSEDVDLFIRWSERGVIRLVIPDVVLRYRKYENRVEPTPVTATVGPDGVEIGASLRLLHRSRMRRRETELAGSGRPGRAAATSPAVSVIMTVRNGMPYLQEAVAAIHRQTVAPGEILALVGPSEDGTLEYLRAQPGIRIVEQSETGLAAARNAALKEVKFPLVAFCDHDDLWHPAKLEKQVAVIAQFTEPAACIVNFDTFSDAGSAVPTSPLFRGVPSLGWTPSALLAHRDVFAAIGPFDAALGLGCDTDWFRRLRQMEIPCGVAGSTLLRKRRHAANLSGDPEANRAAMFKMIRKRRDELKHGL